MDIRISISPKALAASFPLATLGELIDEISILGADGTENVDRAGALIVWRSWPRAALGPPAGDLVLLPDPRFILKPVYILALCLLGCDLRQLGGEVFLRAAMARARRRRLCPLELVTQHESPGC